MPRRFLLSCLAFFLLPSCTSAAAEPVVVELIVPIEGIAQAKITEVPVGAEVTLSVTTAKDDSIHVHGYEIEFSTKAQQPTKQVFTAYMSGTYEVESHDTNQVYLKLRVK